MSTSERWREVKRILDQAAEVPPAELGDWLGGVCGGDAELKSEVESLLERGDPARAERFYRESIAMRERLGLEGELRKPRNNLASILMLRGKLDEAEAIYRRSLAERRAEFGDRHPVVATSARSLATARDASL